MPMRLKLTLGILTGIVLLAALIFALKKETIEPSKAHDLNVINKSGRIRIVTENSNIGFQLSGNEVSGFNYEIAKAFANSLGLELEVKVMNDLDSAVDGLWRQKCDVIAMNIPKTKLIGQQLNLTVPIISSRQMLIRQVRNDSSAIEEITSPSELRKQKIYIPKSSPFKMRLENLSDELADTIQIIDLQNVTTEELVKSVSEGKIRYTICDELQARQLQKKFPNINFSTPVGFNQQFCWAVDKKSVKLLEKLNEFLDEFLTTNNYWNIYRRYYGGE